MKNKELDLIEQLDKIKITPLEDLRELKKTLKVERNSFGKKMKLAAINKILTP